MPAILLPYMLAAIILVIRIHKFAMYIIKDPKHYI